MRAFMLVRAPTWIRKRSQLDRGYRRAVFVCPLPASATPYYIFSEILGIPYTWGGLGKAGGSHVSNEYLSVDRLRQFEKSIVSFLYRFAVEYQGGSEPRVVAPRGRAHASHPRNRKSLNPPKLGGRHETLSLFICVGYESYFWQPSNFL